MIGTNEIAKLIANPVFIAKDNLSSMEELSEKYPYSQLFSILLLKGLKSFSDVSFEDKLAQHSYRISDRVQLYSLIQEKAKAEPISIELESEPEEIINEEIIIQENKEVEIVEDSIADLVINTEKSIVNSDVEKNNESKDALDENILHHVYAAGFQLEELTKEEENRLEQNKEIDYDSVQKVEIQVSEDSELSFAGWLHSNSNYEDEITTDKDEINSIVNGFDEFDPSIDLFGEVQKPKKEFFSPSKKAKESLDENSLPVSETLAKIYYLQGNYPKAISAYEQLSLNNPEKKIFFANLITDLKTKLKTK